MHAALFAAPVAGTFDVSDRTEVRVRYPGLAAGEPSLDVETAPDAKLALHSDSAAFRLEYSPVITAWDLNVTGLQPAVLQNGALGLAWHNDDVALSVDEHASYGTQNYASLQAVPPPGETFPRVDVLPPNATIQYVASLTTLRSVFSLRRWRLTAEAGYQLGGGSDAVAQTLIPYQSGPLGMIEGDYALTRRDHLVSSLAVGDYSFSSGAEDLLVEADEAWRHLFTRSTSFEALAGVSQGRTRLVSTVPYDYPTYPVLGVRLGQHIGSEARGGGGQLSVKIDPVVNRMFGNTDERFEAQAIGTWAMLPLRFNLTASYAESLDESQVGAVRLFLGEARVTWEINKYFWLDGGERLLVQDPLGPVPVGSAVTPYTLFPLTQEVTFVGLTIRAPTTRL